MKTHKHIVLVLVGAVILGSLFLSTALGQEKQGPLTQIIIYKGETAGTGTGLTAFKLTVGEEITVTPQKTVSLLTHVF